MDRFTICREDWSLHRKGYLDQKRHWEKVREAIESNIADIISEESIVMSDGRRVVKVPIRSIQEYRFRYDHNKQNHVGHGTGNTKTGDVLACGRPAKGDGRSAPGNEPGVDYYEAEVTIEEVSEILFQNLALPNLKASKKPRMVTEGLEFTDIRKKGTMSNLDRKRTILEALKRNALQGGRGLPRLKPEDLRFKTWEVKTRPEANAVVLAMMDTSGSMGPFEKYIARTFFFWMVRFLRTNYGNVDIVFLAHHTEARETTEEEFFTKGESGGTRCSSVYHLALQLIKERYNSADHNVYAFHFSDGDNLSSDNELCVQLVRELVRLCCMVGYGEIESPYYYTNTLRTALKAVQDPRFVTAVIRDKGEVYGALKAFFSPWE